MRFCILVSVFLVLSSLGLADPLWVRTYNGSYDDYDEVHAIGADDSGNVIVSGESYLADDDAELVTIKYRPDGDTAWLRHFNPGSGLDGATALAVDRSGNIIVTGYQGSGTSTYGDWITIKYSPTGESLWTAVYDLGSDDRPEGVVVDSAGNSYVAGIAGGINDYRSVVVKYTPDGGETWVFGGEAAGLYDGTALAVDPQGYLYLTGARFEPGSPHRDIVTWKVSPEGDSVWVRTYGSPTDSTSEYPVASAVDHQGNLLVLGASFYATPSVTSYLLIKYHPDGETLWTRRYTRGTRKSSSTPAAMVIDQADNIYVTGVAYLDTNLRYYTYATVKYRPDGTQCWAVLRQESLPVFDEARDIALDRSGNIYVTGKSYYSPSGWDVLTIGYDSAGNRRGTERYDHPSQFDEGCCMAVNASGEVFVGGITRVTSTDYLTLCYTAVGGFQESSVSRPVKTRPIPTIARGSIYRPQSEKADLLDAAGQKVMALAPGANDVSRLAPGMYFIRADAEGKSTQKVVVTR